MTTKREAFILVSKCTNAETMVKISKTLFQDIVLTMFGMYGQTHGQTHKQPEHIKPLATMLVKA